MLSRWVNTDPACKLTVVSGGGVVVSCVADEDGIGFTLGSLLGEGAMVSGSAFEDPES